MGAAWNEDSRLGAIPYVLDLHRDGMQECAQTTSRLDLKGYVGGILGVSWRYLEVLSKALLELQSCCILSGRV